MMDSRISLIEQVITEASKSFITGHENNKAFRKKAEGDLSLQEKLKGWVFLSFKDKHFKSDANLIPGTHFVASAGPRGIPEMRDFFDDTVYNEKFPIKQILNLGDCTAYDRDDHQDFHDYCLKERTARFGSIFLPSHALKVTSVALSAGIKHFPKPWSSHGSLSVEYCLKIMMNTLKLLLLYQQMRLNQARMLKY